MAGHDPRAVEELLRSLANAANAVRLYPPTSDLPMQAIGRFVALAQSVTAAAGPVRFIVEPKRFTFAEQTVAPGNAQVQGLAETLYAHQVGQLIVAPGLEAAEVSVFVSRVAMEPTAVRGMGGIRASLAGAGVSHLAVIEVSLRAATEEGLLGLDLATAPLDEIGPEIAKAAEKWERTVVTGEGKDELSEALGKLESATQDLATKRVVQALMRLDEATRLKVMHSALARDAQGNPMPGMMEVVARMSPAALARLLKFTAARAGADAQAVLGGLRLPPNLAKEVQALLKPSPRSEEEMGVPPEADAPTIAAEACDEDESDLDRIKRQVEAGKTSVAARGLRTSLSLAKSRPSEETLEAVADALPLAIKAHAYDDVREAAQLIQAVSSDPALSRAVGKARHVLSDPNLLRSALSTKLSPADEDTLVALLFAAGPAGADAYVTCYAECDTATRERLSPLARRLGEGVIIAAGRQIRNADAGRASLIVRLLGETGDKRVAPSLAQALDNLDVKVRREALKALADIGGEDSKRTLIGAINHWDPETRRLAVKEIGRARIEDAVPAMLKILQGYYLFERNYELKKEVIESLEAVGSPKAVPTLSRLAKQPFVIGRRNRELQFKARKAVEHLGGA